MTNSLEAPFPWFGGKSRCADLVWSALGNVDNYVEPFFGSGAVLLMRPHEPKVETVNDIDHYIVNFWRAIKNDPEQVAYYANNPVNEADLTARHIWLVTTGAERIARLEGDPDFYDPKVAGWWVWGISCWIGSGWCSGSGAWKSVNGRLEKVSGDETSIKRQIPHIGDGGNGIHRKALRDDVSVSRQLPHLGDMGRGVNRYTLRDDVSVTRQLPHLGNTGMGVNRSTLRDDVGVSRQRPHISTPGTGIHRQAFHEEPGDLVGVNLGIASITNYFMRLAERLRYVRVCCGDWSRVVTTGALTHGATVGVFLDPPYSQDLRDTGLYNHDNLSLPTKVRQWCIENQNNPRYRIVVAGYDGEHNELEALGWRKIAWKANRAYATGKNKKTKNNENRHKERLWLSPNCIMGQLPLIN